MEKIHGKINYKRMLLLIISIIIFDCIIIGNYIGNKQEENNNSALKSSINENKNEVEQKKDIICDGINVTENCKYDNIEYKIYKYYPAVEEKSHTETRTTYRKEITGYCTLCNDGTYSPSCATGRGACSHHGGVAQWNAPVYTNKPYHETIKIIDSPAIAERYEKVLKNN